MAAGGSRSKGEGVLRGRHEVVSKKNLDATGPLTLEEVATIDSLEDLCGWLGTFRERLRVASGSEHETVQLTVEHLESRVRQRRSEVS